MYVVPTLSHSEPAGLFYVIMMVVEKCIWKISSVPIDEIFLLHLYK